MMDDNARLRRAPSRPTRCCARRWWSRRSPSAGKAEEIGLPADQIVISAKVSRVQDLIAVYRELARRCATRCTWA